VKVTGIVSVDIVDSWRIEYLIFNASPITGQCPIEEHRFGRGVTFPRKEFLRRFHHME